VEATYPDHEHESFRLDHTRADFAEGIGTFDVPMNSEGIYYIMFNLSHLTYHIDEPFDQDPMIESLESFNNKANNMMVHSMKGYKDMSINLDLIAQSIQSASYYGAQRYVMEGGFKKYSDRFEMQVVDYKHGSSRTQYGADVLMHLMYQMGNKQIQPR